METTFSGGSGVRSVYPRRTPNTVSKEPMVSGFLPLLTYFTPHTQTHLPRHHLEPLALAAELNFGRFDTFYEKRALADSPGNAPANPRFRPRPFLITAQNVRWRPRRRRRGHTRRRFCERLLHHFPVAGRGWPERHNLAILRAGGTAHLHSRPGLATLSGVLGRLHRMHFQWDIFPSGTNFPRGSRSLVHRKKPHNSHRPEPRDDLHALPPAVGKVGGGAGQATHP